MTLVEQRNLLETLREQIQTGRDDEALRLIERSLAAVGGDRLLTTTQAAHALGIGSVNTVKVLCKAGTLAHIKHGSRTMIPLREVERLQGTSLVRGIHASERDHAATDALGDDGGLTQEQLDALEAARPGVVPWER